jgi:hypothetical protein
MPEGFLAFILPVSSGGAPTHPIAPGGPPPVAGWTPPGYQPSHPIAPGGRPPGIWGGAPPYPDQGLPPSGVGIWPGPGGPSQGPGFPTHPIAPGGQPPGIWGGAPSYPDQGLPPAGVGVWPSPGHPSLPIYIPPGSVSAPSQPVNDPPTDSPYWQQVFVPSMGGWVWAIIPPPQGQGGEGSSTSP